ncbi:SURF1 family cytochrome oxidase biogenesis protein [Microbacterium sp. ZXX196]|uniref:SURF1 family cytochrome oxidase biogenesis protein n=1 Tax=Microbacterium sp. ZXX196 TaxID=2609291 RepID=UPI0012BA1695|nr:SURF1 family cytochrome oxidase biogenesis protein [Microbacterium sp. ZXX196]MTE24546.1 SURF1 family protein [Microbacterium sp. ZXX196]
MTPEPAPDPDAPEFPPTLREVMLRPRWLGMLALCLVVAGVFAWLLQWQLARAIDTDPLPEGVTEEVRPIAEVVEPGAYLAGPYVGQRVDVEGVWDPDDFLVVTQRVNDGAEGAWVTGRLVTEAGDSLAVAIGWAEDPGAAEDAIAELEAAATGEVVGLTGRVISDEGPAVATGDDPFEMTRMSPAALLGQWTGVTGDVYRVYFTSMDPTGGIADAGLSAISSAAPEESGSVNWLNLFYAAEWAIFAGFSFYLWYRLAKDAWEREVEEFTGADPDEDA